MLKSRVLKKPLIRDLRRCLGAAGVLSEPADLRVYDCDGLTIEKRVPEAVVFPTTTEEVAEVVRICDRHDAPIVARGAGTSLAGGCLPIGGGVVLMLTRMKRILEINVRDRMALVEAGVLNLQLARALTGTGLHFAPDPSSQIACTIGGNVATNAGGPHTLKYGVTLNHVLGVEAVLGDGTVIKPGPLGDRAALDLTGLLVGSEGTLAIVTKAWLKLTPNPQDYRTLRVTFDSLDHASNAISDVIASGIVPAAMELMDKGILGAVDEAFQFGFPDDAEAMVVIELDGPSVGLDDQRDQITEICNRHEAREILQATDAEQRALLWKCRKMAVGAVGRLSPSYCIQDGVVPRTKLPHIIRRIAEISVKYSIRIVNVAHAGDGNIHPILLFDDRDTDQVQRALAAGKELLEDCIDCGGSVTAEHGIGIEKISLMESQFAPNDLGMMEKVRDAFNPGGGLGLGKLLPSPHAPTLLHSAELTSDV